MAESHTVTASKYPGASLYLSADGCAGVVLQQEGNLAGFMWDFFVSPDANSRMTYDLLLLAIAEGGRMLTTRQHPLLVDFFVLFGFQSLFLTPAEPEPFLHMMLVDKIFRAKEASIREILNETTPRIQEVSPDGQRHACSYCRHEAPSQFLPASFFGGYRCRRCRFMRVVGTLTLPPTYPQPSPQVADDNSPRKLDSRWYTRKDSASPLKGPFEMSSILDALQSGDLSPRTEVCPKHGGEDWCAIDRHPAFRMVAKS
jgi:hypothetical protein